MPDTNVPGRRELHVIATANFLEGIVRHCPAARLFFAASCVAISFALSTPPCFALAASALRSSISPGVTGCFAPGAVSSANFLRIAAAWSSPMRFAALKNAFAQIKPGTSPASREHRATF